MYQVLMTASFRRDLKRCVKRGLPRLELEQVAHQLASGTPLDPRYRDHALTGDMIGYRECHIRPDWLLVYQIKDYELVLVLTRTGSHADLFQM